MLRKIRSLVKSNPVAFRCALAIRSVLRPATEDVLRRLVRTAAQHVDQPVFVKVGANDGVTDDPFGESLLRTRSWKGLLIDPVPYCVDRLKLIYHDQSRFTIEQIAVGPTSGRRKFYYVADEAKSAVPDLPDWYDKIGSFDRGHLDRHLSGDFAQFVVEADVDCEPLDSVLRRNRMTEITLLHIDTEGHDLDVLKSLNLDQVTPSWIMVEHKHLSSADRKEMITRLTDSGYDVSNTGTDFFAMHRGADHGLQRDGCVGRLYDREFLVSPR